MRTVVIFAAWLASLALGAASARAGSVTAKLSIGPADIVTLSDPDPALKTLYTGAVYAGELDWTSPDPTYGSFSTYCIDILSDIYLNCTYSYVVHPITFQPVDGKGLTCDQTKDISLLWGKYHDCICQPDAQDTADRAAAFQIDIWKILYPNLTVTPAWGSSGWQTYQSCWLSDLGTNPANLVSLDSASAQDQAMLLTGNVNASLQAVPTPSSFGGGIFLGAIGIGACAFRKVGLP